VPSCSDVVLHVGVRMVLWVVFGESVGSACWSMSLCRIVGMASVACDFELEAWCSVDGLAVWSVLGL
jgi:hypothetical protein